MQALRHVGAAADFVPPDVEQVRFSNQRDPSRAPISPRVLTLEERCQLYSFFAEDIARLESMLGRDLARWRPDCGALDGPS